MDQFNFKHPLLLSGLVFLLISCNNKPRNFQGGYDPVYWQSGALHNYRVRDHGGLKAVITGKGCSTIDERALYSAKKAAEFNLRTLLGNKRYLPNFKVLRHFREEKRICYEIQASAMSS